MKQDSEKQEGCWINVGELEREQLQIELAASRSALNFVLKEFESLDSQMRHIQTTRLPRLYDQLAELKDEYVSVVASRRALKLVADEGRRVCRELELRLVVLEHQMSFPGDGDEDEAPGAPDEDELVRRALELPADFLDDD